VTERTKLISYLLNGLFSEVVIFHIRFGVQKVIRDLVHWTESNLAMRHSFFDNETIYVFIRDGLEQMQPLTFKKETFFIVPDLYKKLMPSQQPIRARVLL